jgi:benzoyl-CoA reductase/2-hydroxyglutaryl-CoA dehydratase subunit BcrC/BadD/HgdB
MKDALKELRKVVQIPDQKHWNCMEMRERALEEWIDKWIIVLEHEQTVLNSRYLTTDFQDFLKEHVGKKLTEKAMEDAIDITMENTKIKGKLACLKRRG